MINIILLESQVLVRKALKSLLEIEPDIKVVAEADHSHQVIELVENNVFADIVLAELNLGKSDEYSMIKQLATLAPHSKLAFLSTDNNEKDVVQAINMGAKGCLNKSVGVNELLFAIRHIFNDGYYICSKSSMMLLKRMQQFPTIEALEVDNHKEFSVREIEILSLMGEGYTNQEIAERLFTSKRTVENHRQHMLNKTGSRNTAALIKYSFHYGIIR